MPEYISTVDRQINTDLARTFRAIVTAGWANQSDGTVEAPTGAFALVLIAPAELAELADACLENDDIRPYPGSYLVVEDSDGNTELVEYLSDAGAKSAFRIMQREYAIWDATCPECGNEGPHDRLNHYLDLDNPHRCVCGNIFDPTAGI